MNDIVNAGNTKKQKKVFSLENKKKLYQQWKESHQSKHEFCKSAGVSKTSFYKWCQWFECPKKKDEKNKKNPMTSFVPITCEGKSSMSLGLKEIDEDFVPLEWALLNGMKIVFQVPAHKINALIKESCHAARIIR